VSETDFSLPEDFSERLLSWQAQHGRTGMPWQGTQDPYRVWLSEIMLQQTQVSTVIDYYGRFVARFPTVADLAAASQDEVLALWAGLGYYSRARHLHACAQAVMREHAGAFPRTALALQSLPGIGPSTAAAIASFCYAERVAILDGNVKRVLTRVLGFGADLAQAKNERQLLQFATELLPRHKLSIHMPRYTQAIMDLGATVCTARSPSCLSCPMQKLCRAHQQGKVHAFPVKTKKLKRTSQSIWLLLARNQQGQVFLQRRPTPGVWAGLYCLPMFNNMAELESDLSAAQRLALQAHPPLLHVLTHKDLHLHVMELTWLAKASPAQEGVWTQDFSAIGLPAPIAKLLLPES
jgi:A/G-specific adenine glycosylase